MSRSGYIDNDSGDQWTMIRWRGAVMSAIRGKRGQKLLREMRDALDAMPHKRLISGVLKNKDGDVCALGAVGNLREIDMTNLDPEEPEQVAAAFGVSDKLVREIAYQNDDWDDGEKRWKYMRKWVERHITEPT